MCQPPQPCYGRGLGGGGCRDILEWPYTRGGGGVPPPFTFQCLRLTAKILLGPFGARGDLSLKFFGPPLAGTIGGLKEERCPSQTPLPPLTQPPPHLPGMVGPAVGQWIGDREVVGSIPGAYQIHGGANCSLGRFPSLVSHSPTSAGVWGWVWGLALEPFAGHRPTVHTPKDREGQGRVRGQHREQISEVHNVGGLRPIPPHERGSSRGQKLLCIPMS